MGSTNVNIFFGRKVAGDPNGAVLITGISGRLGRMVASRAHRDYPVIGIDRRPFDNPPKDIVVHNIDIRRKRVEKIFRTRPIRAVIHMAIIHDPRMNREQHHSFNVMGTKKILSYVTRFKIPKVVILSSANVYGPRPENTQFLTEGSPLMAAGRFGDIGDLVLVDLAANTFFWEHPDMETVILRPTHVVGPVHNAPSNYLRLKKVPTMMGYDPMVQVIHVEDVVRALLMALRPGLRGVFNIIGPDPVALSGLIRAIGKPRLPLPAPLFEEGLRMLWRFRMTSFPPPELDYIRYICTLDGTRAKKGMGYKAKYRLKDIIDYFKKEQVS